MLVRSARSVSRERRRWEAEAEERAGWVVVLVSLVSVFGMVVEDQSDIGGNEGDRGPGTMILVHSAICERRTTRAKCEYAKECLYVVYCTSDGSWEGLRVSVIPKAARSPRRLPERCGEKLDWDDGCTPTLLREGNFTRTSFSLFMAS